MSGFINKYGRRIKAISRFIFILLLISSNQSFAQKIKTIKHKKRNYPERIVTVDTLNIEIYLKELNIAELRFYSILNFSNIPPDLSVLLNSSDYKKNKNIQDDLYVLYHLKKSDFYGLYNSYNFQNFMGYINPFLQQSGQKKYQVFEFEILNNHLEKLLLNPDEISAITQNNVRKSAMTLDDFEELYSYENNFIEQKMALKILEDNLFQAKIIYPSTRVNGLVCFPRSGYIDKILKIRISNIKIYNRTKFNLDIVF